MCGIPSYGAKTEGASSSDSALPMHEKEPSDLFSCTETPQPGRFSAPVHASGNNGTRTSCMFQFDLSVNHGCILDYIGWEGTAIESQASFETSVTC